MANPRKNAKHRRENAKARAKSFGCAEPQLVDGSTGRRYRRNRDYVIDYEAMTIKRTANSRIPSGGTVRIVYTASSERFWRHP